MNGASKCKLLPSSLLISLLAQLLASGAPSCLSTPFAVNTHPRPVDGFTLLVSLLLETSLPSPVSRFPSAVIGNI